MYCQLSAKGADQVVYDFRTSAAPRFPDANTIVGYGAAPPLIASDDFNTDASSSIAWEGMLGGIHHDFAHHQPKTFTFFGAQKALLDERFAMQSQRCEDGST